MLFHTFKTVQSKKNSDELKNHFIGKHCTIHQVDFEVKQTDEITRLLPNIPEGDTHVYTLPVSRLSFTPNDKGTLVKISSHPRRIDIGGIYLLFVFIVFAIIAGFMLLSKGGGEYNNTAYLLIGASIAIFAAMYIRLQMGYFDYVRKIKAWVKTQA